jgi:hypothetical protein
MVYLDVNLIAAKKFWPSGEEVPDHVPPRWVIKEHKIGPVEAQQIRQRRAELRAAAAERREAAAAKREAKANSRRQARQKAGS